VISILSSKPKPITDVGAYNKARGADRTIPDFGRDFRRNALLLIYLRCFDVVNKHRCWKRITDGFSYGCRFRAPLYHRERDYFLTKVSLSSTQFLIGDVQHHEIRHKSVPA
jgi:hypothetical protein